MSLWTDIRDAVTAPFRGLGSFVQDIAQGDNFFESLGSFASREFVALNPTIALNTPIINNTPVKDVLDNKYFNALTAGVGKNIVDFSSFAQQSNTGVDQSWTEIRDGYIAGSEATLKVGAAVLSAGAAPAGASAYTVGAAGLAGANTANAIFNKVETGDFLGALSSTTNYLNEYTGLPEIPQDVKDAIAAGKDVKDEAQKAYDAAKAARDAANQALGSSEQAQGLVDLTKSNIPLISKGYSSTTPGGGSSSESASSIIPLVVVGGALAFILLKGKK